jgi:hypothetical protein
MTLPGLRRPIATWRFVIGLVRSMTQPPADIARCDERVETLAADSRIVRALSASVNACRRACTSSALVAAWRRTVSPLVPGPLADRVRGAGCLAAVAAATTLMLRMAGTEHDPYTWVLPAVVVVIAAVSFVAAEAIARAIASYHS